MKKRWLDLPVFAPPQATQDRLAIASLRAWRVKEPDSGRRYTIVKVESRGGDFGFGEGGPAKSDDLAAAKAAVPGVKATALEWVRNRFAAQPSIEAAVSNAFVDLMARATKVPIYRYLGGPTRFKARLLAKLDGIDETSLQAPLRRAQERGFKAFTVPVPPRQTMTRLQDFADSARRRLDAFQKMAGGNAEVVLDGGGSLLPGDAALLARSLEKEHPIWFDEPTGVLTNDALARITEESVMPVGLGRHVHDIATFQNLLRWGCVDVVRPSLGLNSIHKVRRISALAETHYIAVAPHHDGGPIATMAGIHLAASLPNFYTQQVPIPASARDAAMRAELLSGAIEQARDGFAPLVNQPGLGVQVSEQALARYSEETL